MSAVARIQRVKMPGSTKLFDEQLKARLNRLLSGDLRTEDVAKLYIGKRSSTYGRRSFREIADFAAHPDLRNKGPVTDRIRDMRTTFKPMIDNAFVPKSATIEQLLDRAESNLRMANDEQIKRFSNGLSRKQAEAALQSALEKMRAKAFGSLIPLERLVLIRFGDSVIWNPALRAQEVFEDFRAVMIKNKLMVEKDSSKLERARALIILHAITAMHGTEFDLGDGIGGTLQAGFDNQYGNLEITTALHLTGYLKPVSLKIGMFWTDLAGKDHACETLLNQPGPWDFPVEIHDNKLSPIGEASAAMPRDPGTAVINFPQGTRRESSVP